MASATTTTAQRGAPVPWTPKDNQKLESLLQEDPKGVQPVKPEVISTPPPAAPLPPPRKRRSWTRRFLWLSALLGIGYAGSVYFALINDNFHDFFTEYVPFGELSVGFFEERDFKRRFPDGNAQRLTYPQVSGEKKVNIKSNSGMSARVAPAAEGSDLSSNRGPHASATSQPKKEITPPSSGLPDKTSAPGPGMTSKTSEPAKPATLSTQEAPKAPSAAPPAPPAPAATTTNSTLIPALGPPIALIDNMHVENATDPIVQEITRMLNDVITVVNADKAQDKYSTTIEKAKQDIHKVANDMAIFRATEAQSAEQKIRDSELQFDEGAKALLKRIKQEQEEQELHWRQEYEAERERLAKAYQDKLSADVEAAQRVGEQNKRNALLDQEIKLKEYFTTQVQERVETERSGRLSKLTELTTDLSELEQLTSKWNEVVDSNLKTQHLNVAVDAVKSVLDSADRPKPFLHELVALKEIASEDPVVNAAIASINPAAYQRGVPTIAQLVDRFRRVAGEVRKAALLPEDAGVASHAASFLLSRVMFKKSGIAEGNDVESILTRAETFLEEGELDEAAREMNGLQGWAKVLSKDWLSETRRVLEVKQALDVSADRCLILLLD